MFGHKDKATIEDRSHHSLRPNPMFRAYASLAIIAIAIASMTFTTYAYFNDQDSVTGTSFVTGTMALGIGDTTTFQTDLSRTAIAPGDSVSGSLNITSTGTITGALDWKALVTTTDAAGGTTDIAAYLVITNLSYGGDDHLSSADGGVALTDRNGNGWIDLQDLALTGPLTGLAAPGPTGSPFEIALLFHTTADNALQGDSASLELIFHLRQAAGTPLA